MRIPDDPSVPPVIGGDAPPRVLIVDDDPRLAGALAELLDVFDIQVVGTVSTGAAAVGAITAANRTHGGVDVVLMDVRLPDMDGLQAAGRCRERYPEVAVVLHSAYAGQLGDRPGLAGIFDEVGKGTHPGELVAVIERACTAARAGNPTGR